MIKINLATRKQSEVVQDPTAKKSNVNISAIKDLPIRKIMVPVVTGLVATWLLDTYKEEELKKLELTSGKLSTERAKLQAEVSKFKSYEAIKKSLDEDELVVKTKLETIQKLIADRSDHYKLLLLLSDAIPKDVWLSDFTLAKGEMKLLGASLEFNQISDFIKNLSENSKLLDVTLKNTQREKDRNGMDVAVFEITAKWR